jgi:hypothetical protein
MVGFGLLRVLIAGAPAERLSKFLREREVEEFWGN